MASQEFLDQLGNSSSTSDEDGDDASTSSEDMNGLAVSSSSNKVAHSIGPLKIGNNSEISGAPMQVDSPNSEPKRRIKLTLRPSITPTDDSMVPPPAADGTNGIKKEVLNGEASFTALGVKQEPNNRCTPPPSQAAVVKASMEKRPKSPPPPPKTIKVETKEKTAGPAKKPKTKKKKTSVVKGKEGAVKAKKTEAKVKIKKDGKTKKDGKVKVKKVGAASNGTAKIASTLSSPGPPKKTKKKLPKLPLSMKRKLPVKGASIASEVKVESTGSATAVKATVVDSNEAVEDDVVAVAVVESPAPTTTSSTAVVKPTAKAQPTEKKRQQAKPIRLPPMTSPGLLISHLAAGTYRSAVDSATGFAKPETVFEQSMAMAGYTTEGRTKDPHRGSSVKRVVGDMFDSDVGFTLNFPELVPKDLWDGEVPEKGNSAKADSTSPKVPPSLLLMNSLKECKKKGGSEVHEIPQANGKDSNHRKRQRPWEFRDMIPVSLTIPYPESFVEKRLKYVKEVDEREKAIVAYQQAEEKMEMEQEEKELQGKQEEGSEKSKAENPVKVPPIPSPPSPPPLSAFKGLDVEQYEDNHPIHVPKGKQTFVAHLDQDCFHTTEGRYFGLTTNTIADPHFVGANAPGVAGLPVSVGSGLATSSTSSGTAVKSESVLAVPPSSTTTAAASKAEGTTSEKSPTKKESSTTTKPAKKTASLPAVKSGSKSKFKLKHVGPTPTANASDLRKLMDEGGEMAEKTKQCIIRAAVHASRSGKHGQSFLAPDGKAYPDVSKAFAAHAGLKPCARCKNNKQGAYHCRLRRKHKELDHDGSNSPAELAPLLLIPMEDLLIQPKSSK